VPELLPFFRGKKWWRLSMVALGCHQCIIGKHTAGVFIRPVLYRLTVGRFEPSCEAKPARCASAIIICRLAGALDDVHRRYLPLPPQQRLLPDNVFGPGGVSQSNARRRSSKGATRTRRAEAYCTCRAQLWTKNDAGNGKDVVSYYMPDAVRKRRTSSSGFFLFADGTTL